MTVKELKEQLSHFNDDMDVAVMVGRDVYYGCKSDIVSHALMASGVYHKDGEKLHKDYVAIFFSTNDNN